MDQRLLNLSVSYRFEDRERTEAFLRDHPDLLPFVEQSAAHVRAVFPDANLWLTVDLDEGEDDSPEEERLFILIETADETDEVLNRLDKLDEAWAASLWDATDGRVVIDLKA